MEVEMIRVILIEDDPMVQEINRLFVERIDGFKVIGCASNGAEGIEIIKKEKPDLALIDIYMPNQDGLTTIKQIRAEGLGTDIIAITAASDIETIRRVLQHGAFDYIIKPFKYERIKQALTNFRDYHLRLQKKEAISQHELDKLLIPQVYEEKIELPKGLNILTLEKVSNFLKKQTHPISAEEVAEGIGIARVTARRYLEYLGQSRTVSIHIEYGGVGRPINQYKINKN
jgi:two-component system response regulator DctR